jgi:hypothetical protein
MYIRTEQSVSSEVSSIVKGTFNPPQVLRACAHRSMVTIEGWEEKLIEVSCIQR